MSSFAYDNFLHDACNGRIQAGDTFYVMLVDGSYVPSQGAHSKRSDITGEVVGQGYIAGGKQVFPTFTKNAQSHQEQIVFPAVSWPNSTLSAARAVYFKHRGGLPIADELVAQNDFNAIEVTDSSEFILDATTIVINSAVGVP